MRHEQWLYDALGRVAARVVYDDCTEKIFFHPSDSWLVLQGKEATTRLGPADMEAHLDGSKNDKPS